MASAKAARASKERFKKRQRRELPPRNLEPNSIKTSVRPSVPSPTEKDVPVETTKMSTQERDELARKNFLISETRRELADTAVKEQEKARIKLEGSKVISGEEKQSAQLGP